MTERVLPAVLGVEPHAGREPCHCFCSVRHPATRGVGAGSLSGDGVLVFLNSLWSNGRGVAVCGPCARAWPELRSP